MSLSLYTMQNNLLNYFRGVLTIIRLHFKENFDPLILFCNFFYECHHARRRSFLHSRETGESAAGF